MLLLVLVPFVFLLLPKLLVLLVHLHGRVGQPLLTDLVLLMTVITGKLVLLLKVHQLIARAKHVQRPYLRRRTEDENESGGIGNREEGEDNGCSKRRRPSPMGQNTLLITCPKSGVEELTVMPQNVHPLQHLREHIYWPQVRSTSFS